MAECRQENLALASEKRKASIRAKVEHPSHVVKNIFKHTKARDKRISKNDAHLNALFALSNLYMVKGKLYLWWAGKDKMRQNVATGKGEVKTAQLTKIERRDVGA